MSDLGEGFAVAFGCIAWAVGIVAAILVIAAFFVGRGCN